MAHVDVGLVREAILRLEKEGAQKSAKVVWDLLDEWIKLQPKEPVKRGASVAEYATSLRPSVGVDENRVPERLCSFCKKNPGTLREDPYQAEINGDHSLVLMCDDCEQKQADEI